jgi:geranylgeranyl reductase family protein
LVSQESQSILKTDICIVGGSIAGNYLAFLLRQRNISCIVIEEHNILGKPCHCAGIVSQKIIQMVSFPSELILNRVTKAQVVAPNLSTILMQGKESPVILDRIGFDAYFGDQAQNLGAQYLLGEKYLWHWILKDRTIKIKTDKRFLNAKVLIGADGAFSKVAARMGMKNNWIPATQALIQMKYDTTHAGVYFDSEWKELFGYVVPEGKNGICRVGVACSDHPNLALKKFLKILKISPSQIIAHQGGVIPFGFPRKIAFQNTVLIGDAACMVKATTGGGIIMIIAASKILAQALQKSLIKGDFSEKFFQKYYEGPIKRHLGLQLKIHYFFRMILMRLTKFDFNLFFKLYQTTDLHITIEKYADMDFPLPLLQQLLRNRPFIQFLLHIILSNWRLIPQFIHDIAL